MNTRRINQLTAVGAVIAGCGVIGIGVFLLAIQAGIAVSLFDSILAGICLGGGIMLALLAPKITK